MTKTTSTAGDQAGQADGRAALLTRPRHEGAGERPADAGSSSVGVSDIEDAFHGCPHTGHEGVVDGFSHHEAHGKAMIEIDRGQDDAISSGAVEVGEGLGSGDMIDLHPGHLPAHQRQEGQDRLQIRRVSVNVNHRCRREPRR